MSLSIKTCAYGAGIVCIIAALLIPSCCIGLPQLFAAFHLFNAPTLRCLVWLDRLRPLFVSIAVSTLVYQLWAVFFRSAPIRTQVAKTLLTASISSNLLVMSLWAFLDLRYR